DICDLWHQLRNKLEIRLRSERWRNLAKEMSLTDMELVEKLEVVHVETQSFGVPGLAVIPPPPMHPPPPPAAAAAAGAAAGAAAATAATAAAPTAGAGAGAAPGPAMPPMPPIPNIFGLPIPLPVPAGPAGGPAAIIPGQPSQVPGTGVPLAPMPGTLQAPLILPMPLVNPAGPQAAPAGPAGPGVATPAVAAATAIASSTAQQVAGVVHQLINQVMQAGPNGGAGGAGAAGPPPTGPPPGLGGLRDSLRLNVIRVLHFSLGDQRIAGRLHLGIESEVQRDREGDRATSPARPDILCVEVELATGEDAFQPLAAAHRMVQFSPPGAGDGGRSFGPWTCTDKREVDSCFGRRKSGLGSYNVSVQDTGSSGAQKGRDGVPAWDGSADTFQSYCESAQLYEQATPYHKRYLVAPRLLSELQGSARRLVVGQPADWVSFAGGVDHLLSHLRRCLGKPQVPELTELLAKYFKNSRRRPGELMGDYISRKCELYVRAQQAMDRVRPHHDQRSDTANAAAPTWSWQPRQGRRLSTDSWMSGDAGTEASEQGGDGGIQAAAPVSDAGTANTDAAETWRTWEWQSSWDSRGQSWNQWSGYNWYDNSSRAGYWPSSVRTQLPELIPEFVQSWMLLQDAGLEPAERNTVMVATQGDMRLQRVAQELRNHFVDADLKKRDSHRRGQGFLGEAYLGLDEDDDGEDQGPEAAFNAEAELNDEGLAMWGETEQEVQQAMAAMQTARRTLRGARERQKQVKQNRQYYRGSGSSSSQPSGPRLCLRCGQSGHKAAECMAPKPQAPIQKEMAPFICFAQDEVEAAWATQEAQANLVTTAEAVSSGKAVIDCGATKSLGSVEALEHMMRLSQHGVDAIDTGDAPVFGFGNSSEDRCVSTLHLRLAAGGRPGVIRIHALDKGSAPVLMIDECYSLNVPQAAIFYFPSQVTYWKELRAVLIQLGEQPLRDWTKLELAFRIAELTGEDMSVNIKKKSKDKSPMQELTQKLNAAARTRKSELIRFCESELRMTNLDRWTVDRIKMEGMKRVMELTEGDFRDAVSFGRHGLLTYQELYTQEKSYCQWVLQTARDRPTESDPRLRRLARWIESQDHAELQSDSPAKPGQTILALLQKSGYVGSTTVTLATPNRDERVDALTALTKELHAEVVALKSERCPEPVRKKGKDQDIEIESTEGKNDSPATAQPSSMAATQGPSPPKTMMLSSRAKSLETSAWSVVPGLFQELNRKHYVVLGAYSHGNHYGITSRTEQLPETTRIWVEDLEPAGKGASVPNGSTQNTVRKVLPTGEERDGTLHEVRHKVTRPVSNDNFICFMPPQEHVQFMVVIDEGSRSQGIVDFCDREHIFLDNVPADAHWQIGVCEQAVQGLKSVLDKLCADDPDLSPEAALSMSVTVFNHRDQVRGFSPVQHALGKAPDVTGRFIDVPHAVPDDRIIENASEEFRQSAKLRAEAEKAHAEWNARQRVSRALNSRSRKVQDFQPGDLVYFWRSQESGESRKQPGSKQGRFLGPARVLAMESRQSDGTIKPGGIVWCVRGRQLIKCCVEQLRLASEREELLDTLASTQGEESTPWTFTRLAEELGGNQYQDYSQDKPEEDEWFRAQDPEQEVPPVRYRLRRKRAAPATVENVNWDEEDEPTPAEASRPARPRREAGAPQGYTEKAECWYQTIRDEIWRKDEADYWRDQQAAVEVAIDLPQQGRSWNKATENLQSYFVGAMKRQAIEVSEKRLTQDEREAFQQAKMIEVRNFIAAGAFEALPAHLRPSRDQAIGMRWVLTWKTREDGSRKPKARAVLLGYQDPGYAHRATTAPVMTRLSRQYLLQLAATHNWNVYKGEVSGAFLQGREYPGELFCVPCPEILQQMGLPDGSITRLRKACYGLVDAPLEWYKTVSDFLASLGLERLWSDACTWVWRPEGRVRAVISGHVDDFMFTGGEDDQGWQAIVAKIKDRFHWGDWDKNDFIQCGVRIQKTANGGFSLSQPKYVEDIPEIPVNSSRRKQLNESTTGWEKTQLRALLGALSWHAQQVAPHVSAPVGLLLSETNNSTVATLLQANNLLRRTKEQKEHQMLIHPFPPEVELGLFAWVDAASQSPGAAETLAAVNGEDELFFARFHWSELLFGQVNTKEPLATVRRTTGCVVTDSRNVYDKLQTEVMSIKGAEKRANIELLSVKQAQYDTKVQIRWVHSEAQLGNSLTKANGYHELEMFYKMGHCWRIVEDDQMRSARRRKVAGMDPLQQTTAAAAEQPQEGESPYYLADWVGCKCEAPDFSLVSMIM
ncbi:RE1, partial [Symbiodinium sp. CCMP2456]